MTGTMTAYESACYVLGEWGDKLWPVLRDRSDLLHELARISPRLVVATTGSGHGRLRDANAGYRAAYISERCREMPIGAAPDGGRL